MSIDSRNRLCVMESIIKRDFKPKKKSIAKRKCLKCDGMFTSEWVGNRLCSPCQVINYRVEHDLQVGKEQYTETCGQCKRISSKLSNINGLRVCRRCVPYGGKHVQSK